MIINNLTKTFKGKQVLNISSFTFEPNRIYAIIGANGSGKSTLGKCLAGIIPADSPSSIEKSNQKIGYLPQVNYAFAMSAWKNIMLGCTNEIQKEKAKKYMEELDFTSLAKQFAPKLSGGEIAKMALIRLLIHDNDFLVLDEPTASLDVKSTLTAERLIKNHQEERQSTIIIITHSIKQALRLADEVLFLNDGQLLEYGAVQEVINQPKNDLLKEFIKLLAI